MNVFCIRNLIYSVDKVDSLIIIMNYKLTMPFLPDINIHVFRRAKLKFNI